MRNVARFFSLPLCLALRVVAAGTAEPVAAPPPQFSLEAAVRQALAQSPAVRVQESEIDRNVGLGEQASGQFDWVTDASASRVKERAPSVGPYGNDTITAGDTTAYSVSTARQFRNGVSVQPSVSVAVAEQTAPAAPTFGSSQFNLQIVVPLLRGLGTDSTGAAEAAALGDVEVARLLYRHALANQAYGTVQAYWTARATQEALLVRQDDERRAQHLHDGMRVLVDARVFAPSILLQSEANLRQKSTSRQQAELDALNSTIALGRIIGLNAADLVKAPAPEQPLPLDVAVPEQRLGEAVRLRWIARAYAQRADYLATRQSEVPLRILSRQAELDLKPRLDLSVRGGYGGLSRSDSLVTPLSQRLTGLNGQVGLAMEWPAANTFQHGLLRSRRAAQRQAELTTAQAQSDVAADVCTSLEEVRLRAATMRNAAATADIARKAVDQEQRRLKTGEATVLDVINLENLLSSARLSQIDAQAGYAIAIAHLRFAIGEVFTNDRPDHSFQLANLTQLPADEK